MKMGLGAKLGTSLSLTPQLQQAIRLLQLSSLELTQEVQLQIESNPLLELADEFDEQYTEHDSGDAHTTDSNPEMSNQKGDDNQTQTNEAEPKEAGLDELLNQNSLSDDISVDTEWDDVYTHEPTKWDTPVSTDFEVSGQTSDSIQSHIRWQMNLVHLSPVERYICEYLIDSMDNNGFVTIAADTLAQNIATDLAFSNIHLDHELNEADVLVVLKLMQACEPLGVAARDLAECLTLQLNALPDSCDKADAKKLLTNHDLLEKNDIKGLTKATGLSLDGIKNAMALIRTLEPYPAQHFNTADTSYQVPDVLVEIIHDDSQPLANQHEQCTPKEKTSLRYRVRLNPETMPKLGINKTYSKLIKRGDNSKDQAYLKDNLNTAKHFIKAVEERHKSLLKVATAITEAQTAFFEQGEVAMKPLILRDIAEQVDLHESTVSRITTAKYMLTPQGLFELKYFFSSHVGTDTGGECSSTAICAMLKGFIDEENPQKPLSDSKLVKLLQDKGIEVARRTIAKYREQMGIGSSTERKKIL